MNAVPSIGMRVGAVASQEKGTTLLFGYGTYQGEEVPPNEGGISVTALLHELGHSNPKIVLDNGDIVWGCECWWGPEDVVKASIQRDNDLVVELSIADFRLGRIPHVTEAPADGFWTA